MKPRFSFQLLLCGATIALSATGAYALPKFPLGDTWTSEKITPSPVAATLDEALLTLSETASINVLVDATDVPTNITIRPFVEYYAEDPWVLRQSKRGDVIGNATTQGGLVFERSNPNTYVFWAEPDPDKLQNLIIAWQKQLDYRYPAAQPEDAAAVWQQYLAEKHGWNPKPITLAEKAQNAQGLKVGWAWNDLPPDLRDITKAEFAHRVRATDSGPDYRQFEPQWWSQARLRSQTRDDIGMDGNGRVIRGERYTTLYLGSRDPLFPLFTIGKLSPRTARNWGAQPRLIAAQIPAATGASPTAQTPEPAPQVGEEVPPAHTKPEADLSAEAPLRKTVKFSLRRAPLREFLQSIAAQCGVELALDEETSPRVAKARLLARSAGMTASDALRALARLCDGYWVKEDAGYTLRLRERDELHRMMVRLGYAAFYQFVKETPQQREKIGAPLADAIYGAVDPNALQSPQGAPFAQLPPELQGRILRLWCNDNRPSLIVNQQRLDDAASQDVRLWFKPLPKNTLGFFAGSSTGGNQQLGPLSRGDAALGAYTADGKLIAPLFPRFSAPRPNHGDEVEEKIRTDLMGPAEQLQAR